MKPINYPLSNLYKPHKIKRKSRIEAEHLACLKEAQASQLAIANLKKEIASAPQASTFIIEETCTETTVENFIPHSSAGFGDGNVVQLAFPNNSEELTADKIKDILGNEANSNVEIMFKTSDGNFVTVTDEVLQDLQKDGLQYQVIDEDGRLGELQELQLTKDKIDSTEKSRPLIPETFDLFGSAQTDYEDITIEPGTVGDQNSAFIDSKNLEILSLDSEDLKRPFKMMDEKGNIASSVDTRPKAESTLKFSPDMFFADMTDEESSTCDKVISLEDDNPNN
nr:unnamed protein product [Callosobruchus chinensis]